MLAWGLLTVAAVSVALVLPVRWFAPVTSAVILQHRIERLAQGESPLQVRQRWVPLREMGSELPLAVVAAEDQRFPDHFGFDFESLQKALESGGRGGRLRGASTLTQQVAKNLFLWQGRSWVRKGLEAWFAVWIEALWPKRRILEVYLNIAQWGELIYGAREASSLYFAKRPAELSRYEASLLAAVLPNPERFHADQPSAYVAERAAWIRGQMGRLGDSWLDGI